ncbi:cyclophilin-like fold protein [Neisseria dentiae]|uniref:cyclophilin-like fold protein n=1 Tax=Neisseria dentiae TaxID=194197 RepID=UPI0035A033A9
MPQSLPRSNSCPSFVEVGDVMLWQGDTIVVFYERFGSAYSDTRLGKIRETEKLKAAVDKGEVEVRFAAE